MKLVFNRYASLLFVVEAHFALTSKMFQLLRYWGLLARNLSQSPSINRGRDKKLSNHKGTLYT